MEEYFKLKRIPYSKLLLTAPAITDAYCKTWLSAVYHGLKDYTYEQFCENFTNIFWSKPHQSRIRCAIYQDKYSRQEGESMTAH
jgi:predicted lipase